MKILILSVNYWPEVTGIGAFTTTGRSTWPLPDTMWRFARLFLPLLDETDFRGLLSASDVYLVTQQKTESEIAFPSKLVTYLAAGPPVIASGSPVSEVAQIARESGAGTVVAAEDGAALLAAILELRMTDLSELGNSGRAYAFGRWSAERVLGNLERSLTSVAFPMRAREETLQ